MSNNNNTMVAAVNPSGPISHQTDALNNGQTHLITDNPDSNDNKEEVSVVVAAAAADNNNNIASGSSPPPETTTEKQRKLQKKRRRSQVVQNSLQSNLLLLPITAAASSSSISPFFPNLPRAAQPGLMPTPGGGKKTVESRTRATIENRFRAKTVFFYKDGDDYFTQGVRVPISKARFRTVDALMDSLNASIPLPFGVRRLHTPSGKTTIRSLDELQPHGRYIAASSNHIARGVDLEAVERRKRLRADAQKRWNFQQSGGGNASSGGGGGRMPPPLTSSSSPPIRRQFVAADDKQQQHQNNDELAAMDRQQQQQQQQQLLLRSSRSRQGGRPQPAAAQNDAQQEMMLSSMMPMAPRANPFLPITSKQVFFVLNGHPHRVYRALIHPMRRGNLDALLEEISGGLESAIFRIYSFQGDRILSMEQLLQLKDMRAIAVPRHERLQLDEHTQSDILQSAPMRFAQHTSSTSSLPPISKNSSKYSSSRGSQSKSRLPNNNIDRLPAYDNPATAGTINQHRSIANSGNGGGGAKRKRSRSPLQAISSSSKSKPQQNLPKTAFLVKKQHQRNNGGKGWRTTTAGETAGKTAMMNGGIRPRAMSTSIPSAGAENATTIHRAGAASTANTTADSDSGRPRSMMELEHEDEELPIFEDVKEEEQLMRDGEEQEEEEDGKQKWEVEEEDYPEEPPELAAMHLRSSGTPISDARRIRRKSTPGMSRRVIDEERQEDEEEQDKPMATQQAMNEEHHRNGAEEEGERENYVDDDANRGEEIGQAGNVRFDGMEKVEEGNHQQERLQSVVKSDDESADGIISHQQQQQQLLLPSMPPSHAVNEMGGNSAMQFEVIHPHNNVDDGGEGEEPTSTAYGGGQYSDELERILYGQAAVKIQSAWRGYTVRKELKRTRFADHPTYIEDGGDKRSTRRRMRNAHNTNNSTYKPNERHQAIVQRVKTPMRVRDGEQKPTNSVLKKKNSSLLEPLDETLLDSSSDREEADAGGINNAKELVQAKRSLGWEMMADAEKNSSLARTPKIGYNYTITVITGNRWAADTEADLYIVLHGAQADSEQLWLRQEFTNWLQSGANGQRFRQNQSDSFTLKLPAKLGIIRKLTLGHECHGYGAGIFVDRVLVTEDEEEELDDCRQFLFFCNKWFDSGQVDGKLERVIRLSAFYEIGSIPLDNRVTRGRWELVLHNGTEKAQDGTSSQLAITGYGTRGQATTPGLYDSAMAKMPSESLFQVDFGDIGELLKVRIEIDGSGSSPDYFLNFVEFKDLDTEERFVVMCGKWLRWDSHAKGEQPFRELFAFHIGVEPLPLIVYDGKIRVSIPRIMCLSTTLVQVELHGDLGETGYFHVQLPSLASALHKEKATDGKGNDENDGAGADEENENGNGEQQRTTTNGGEAAGGGQMIAVKIDIPFKVEAVSVGRVLGAHVHFEPNRIGQEIIEGLKALQALFQKQNVWPLADNSEFVVGRILLRESAHTPYRYVLTRSQLHEISAPEAVVGQFCTKELMTTEIEGISTRLPKRKAKAKTSANWRMQISLAYGASLLPEVFLCGHNGTSLRMVPLDRSLTDGMISFQPEDGMEDIGELRKIRIASDGKTFLANGIANGAEAMHKEDGNGNDAAAAINAISSDGQQQKDEAMDNGDGRQQQNSPATAAADVFDDNAANGQPAFFTWVEKIRVCDTANGDELRFPAVNCCLQKHSVFEMSAIWPDRSPVPIVVYLVRIVIGQAHSSTPALTVRLNVLGEFGDVGWRTFNNDELERTPVNSLENGEEHDQQSEQITLFAQNTRNSFEFEAVYIGEIESADVEVACDDPDFYLECRELVITDTNTSHAYTFKFHSPFSTNCRIQRCNVHDSPSALAHQI